MTADDVRRRVEALAAEVAGSGEGSPPDLHASEDAIYIAVLRAIADGTAEEPAALASEALKIVALDFERWYA